MSMMSCIANTSSKLLKQNEDWSAVVRIAEEIYSKPCSKLLMVGSGSSKHAAMISAYAFKDYTDLEVEVVSPAYFTDRWQDYRRASTFILFVTQSGYSTNVIEAINLAKDLEFRFHVLTENLDSPAAHLTNEVSTWGCGFESCKFVTTGVMTLVNFLQRIALLNSHIAVDVNSLQIANDFDYNAIAGKQFAIRHLDKLTDASPVVLIGNTEDNACLHEAALKFMEVCKRPALVFESEEFLHGSDMFINSSSLIFVVDDQSRDEKVYQLLKAFKKVSYKTFYVTSRRDQRDKHTVLLNGTRASLSRFTYLGFWYALASSLADYTHSWNLNHALVQAEELFETKAQGYERNEG